MDPQHPAQTYPPSHIYRCNTHTCYNWNLGHCAYDGAACYYAHHHTGKLGPRRPDKTLSCWQWIVYGGCWAGEHRCQYAHFNTGRISPKWTYNRDTSYALVNLRRDGEDFTGVSPSDRSVGEAEVSAFESEKQLTAKTSGRRSKRTKANRRPVEERQQGNDTGSTDLSMTDEGTEVEASLSKALNQLPIAETERRLKWTKTNWHPVEPSPSSTDSSSDPSTTTSSSQSLSPEISQVDDSSNSGESSDYFEAMAVDSPVYCIQHGRLVRRKAVKFWGVERVGEEKGRRACRC